MSDFTRHRFNGSAAAGGARRAGWLASAIGSLVAVVASAQSPLQTVEECIETGTDRVSYGRSNDTRFALFRSALLMSERLIPPQPLYACHVLTGTWTRSRDAAPGGSVTVRIEKDGPITVVILDRRDARNAVDRATAERLADAFRAFDADADARVAVLHGDHGTFCAGADLKALSRGTANRVEPDGDGPMGPSRMLLSTPTIASIAGHAVAGGLELALWCDLRVPRPALCAGSARGA